jgi:hypothetical protein
MGAIRTRRKTMAKKATKKLNEAKALKHTKPLTVTWKHSG